MGLYVVKIDGMKVRSFDRYDRAEEFAENHCKMGKVTISQMNECALPRACGRMYPNLDMRDLRYRPFQSLA